jgi:hypothetical protein
MIDSPRACGLVLAVSCLVFSAGASAGHRHQGADISIESAGALRSCDDWSVRIDGERATVSSETIEIAGSSLSVDAARNGGATIRGGSGRSFSVTLCRAAGAALGAGALSQITMSRSGDRLSVDGPSRDGWAAHLIITAPAGASLRAAVANGPIDARDFDGTLELEASNGPISLDKVSGVVSARTANGPISLDEGAGTVSLRAINGPVTVRLDGSGWIGQSLDASSTNGPVTLAVPRGFASGVELRSAGHAPWRCPESLCGAMAKSWGDDDEEKIVRFGGATTVVRLSTENGPVSVKER